MNNHWLKKFKATKFMLIGAQVAIWNGVEFWKKQPLSLALKWVFEDHMCIEGVYLLTCDGQSLKLPLPNITSVSPGDELQVNCEEVNINSWTLEQLGF